MEYLLPSINVRTTTAGRSSHSKAAPPVDGRSSRWDKHRAERRRELVEAAVRAIRAHGATVGMDGIAAAAGTSKTVFYRHFVDRAGLYRAVTERIDRRIMSRISRAVQPGLSELAPPLGSPRAVLAAAIGSYLHMVEDEPELYRFVMSAPLLRPSERPSSDVAAGVSAQIGQQIGVILRDAMQSLGQDDRAAATWGHAIVGMVRAAADQWLAAGGTASGISHAELTDQLTDLAWGGLSSAWPSGSSPSGGPESR